MALDSGEALRALLQGRIALTDDGKLVLEPTGAFRHWCLRHQLFPPIQIVIALSDAATRTQAPWYPYSPWTSAEDFGTFMATMLALYQRSARPTRLEAEWFLEWLWVQPQWGVPEPWQYNDLMAEPHQPLVKAAVAWAAAHDGWDAPDDEGDGEIAEDPLYDPGYGNYLNGAT